MNSYDESSIKVLDDITHVRTRPAMYLSSERPLYQMFTEILDNSIDEIMNGHGNSIDVCVNYEDSWFSIKDSGRGIPQGLNTTLNEPTPVIIYTKLNSGGKYDDKSYLVAGGLHGVGGVVVNALSNSLHVETWRDGSITTMDFKEGALQSYDKSEYPEKSSGTYVRCYPDLSHKIFTDTLRDYEKDIQDRLSLIKTLLPKIKFTYNGESVEKVEFTEFLPEIKEALLDSAISLEYKDIMIALNWSQETNRNSIKAYCNSIHTPNHGDHVKGVTDALTEVFGTTDASLGLNLAISAMYPGVEYDSQAKLRAISKDMRQFIKEITVKLLKSYLKKNPDVQTSIEELIKSKRKDIDKRNNKSSVKRNRRTTFLNNLGVSGFADCTIKNREEAELYIVEGESAAGTVKQARDIQFQAVCPLRGKFINAYNASISNLLKNQEVSTLLTSIDVGMFQDVNIQNSRYGKIIINTDADPDGRNIACLLLSFFLHVMPELVHEGYVYLALPPLYGTTIKGKFIPINTEEEKEYYLQKGCEIQRYKGLGEMNPEQFSVACMNPDTRQIMQIHTTEDCEREFQKIMGGNSQNRRDILKEVGVLI